MMLLQADDDEIEVKDMMKSIEKTAKNPRKKLDLEIIQKRRVKQQHVIEI